MLILISLSRSQGIKESNPCIENMTSEERDKMAQIPEGKMIFNSSTGCLNYFLNNSWKIFCETQKQENPAAKFDEQSGELQYKIDNQWYKFTMVIEDDSTGEYLVYPKNSIVKNDPTMVSNSVNNISEYDSTSYMSTDCSTKPTRPYAGRDLVSFDMVELEGNRPIHGIGFWQILHGDNGQFVDSTMPNAQFKGTQGITYYLRWTIATKCDTAFDEAMVRIRPPCDPEPSLSFAGPDQINVISTTLNANEPRVGKGSWTIISGLGGYISEPTNPKTAFTGISGTTYVLRWMVRNECGLTQDDVIISIKPPCSPNPSIAEAGEDQIDVEKCKLNATLPKIGRGKWKILEGEKGKLIDKHNYHSVFIGQAGKTYLLQWTISTKCGSSSDEVKISFSTHCPEILTDFRDGNEYKCIKLVNECWMAENLNYRSDFIESYCYDDYNDYCKQFGALYSWKSIMQGESKENAQGICPEGWHVPSDEDWQLLIDSSGYTGIELQINGISGFNIEMSGARYTNGKYLNRREYAYFWSSTSKDESKAWNRYFPYKSLSVDNFPTDKNHSFSVRCIKNK